MSRPINVLAIARLEDEEVSAIRQVDPGIAVRCSVNREDTAALLTEAEVLLASSRLEIDVAEARQLKWVHFLAAGVDQFFRCRHCNHQLLWDGRRLASTMPCRSSTGHEPSMSLPGADILITTSSGIAAVPIAEYVFTTMLSFVRRLPTLLRAQAGHQWIKQNEMIAGELYGHTLGIVGLGHIGERVAGLARAFGLRVLATRRSAAAPVRGAAAAPADEIYPVDRLNDLLAASDFVLLSTPLTGETEGLIGEVQLRAMKPQALLINISRGRVVDEAALTRALQEGWIAGAALDVVAREPLDPTSPLWDMPNALVTPHISAVTEPYSTRGVALFCDNLRRYLAGQPLQNQLDRRKGY